MKTITIEAPKGHEIDLELSNLKEGKIVFKEVKVNLVYENIANELFKGKSSYYICGNGAITTYESTPTNPNNSMTRVQLESILALNKLCNVAKYLNGDWLPDKGRNGNNWFLLLQYEDMQGMYQTLTVGRHGTVQHSCVYFKTKELAKQAIEILGEKEIRKALTLNH